MKKYKYEYTIHLQLLNRSVNYNTYYFDTNKRMDRIICESYVEVEYIPDKEYFKINPNGVMRLDIYELNKKFPYIAEDVNKIIDDFENGEEQWY